MHVVPRTRQRAHSSRSNSALVGEQPVQGKAERHDLLTRPYGGRRAKLDGGCASRFTLE